MTALSLSREKISILLLEGVHDTAVEALAARGYANVTRSAKALDEPELIAAIRGVHVLGIRSRTQVTARVLAAAERLFCVGCFCIGTNQVDVLAARRLGIPVFNAPYSNTRSVAELVLGEVIMLMRGTFEKSQIVHRGGWVKTAKDSYEVRGKTLGIVGYGHIGSQLSVLAEALGMRVRYYDIQKKLALGNAVATASLGELLQASDVVTLHVPETPQTQNLLGAAQLAQMRPGSYLINASRGTVVDLPALAAALKTGHLLGAAVDVFPEEPKSDKEEFQSPLRNLPNVILTPHVGGSTLEAQANIGSEVAGKLIDYSDSGSSVGAVNFPQVQLPVRDAGTRFLHIHRNVPGVLHGVNEAFSSRGLNIAGQHLQTDGEIGYVVVDVDGEVPEAEVMAQLRAVDGTVRARFLYERRPGEG